MCFTLVGHIPFEISGILRCVVAVGKRGKAPGELLNPCGVAIDENTGYIYVAENSDRISVFSETGKFLNTFSHKGMDSPCGIALHRDNIYVIGMMSHVVLHFKMKQQIRHVATFGSTGSSDEQLYFPRGLTVSTDGDVFVADYYNTE